MSESNNALERRTGSAVARRGFNTGIDSANSSADPNYITEMLREAAERYHLVTPATRCGTIPDGCEIMMSQVLVNSDIKLGEVYPITGGGGKLGLGKVTLEKIGNAYGITWDPQQSHREDDASCPEYCEYTAVAHYFDFDGREQTVFGTKSIDLRRGSAMWEDAHERARAKAIDKALTENDNRPLNSEQERRAIEVGYEKAESELRHARIHILALAQSKARLRAIRSIGLKSSYTKEELEKPFVAAKIIFTGRSDNPANEAIYAQARVDHFLGSSRRMYGTVAQPQITAGTNPPPPVSSARTYEADDYIDAAEIPSTVDNGTPVETAGEEKKPDAAASADAGKDSTAAAEQSKTAPEPQTQAATTQIPAHDTTEAEGFVCKFGNKDVKGKKLIDVSNRNIGWLAHALADSVADESKSQWIEKNKRDLRTVQREIARRELLGIKGDKATGRTDGAAPASTAASQATNSTPADSGRRNLFD